MIANVFNNNVCDDLPYIQVVIYRSIVGLAFEVYCRYKLN